MVIWYQNLLSGFRCEFDLSWKRMTTCYVPKCSSYKSLPLLSSEISIEKFWKSTWNPVKWQTWSICKIVSRCWKSTLKPYMTAITFRKTTLKVARRAMLGMYVVYFCQPSFYIMFKIEIFEKPDFFYITFLIEYLKSHPWFSLISKICPYFSWHKQGCSFSKIKKRATPWYYDEILDFSDVWVRTPPPGQLFFLHNLLTHTKTF